MGIFKSEKLDYLQSAYELYIGNVGNEAKNQFEYALWCSWGMGAISVIGGIEAIKGCYKLPDNLNKAKLLLELGIQPMITFWCHNWESQESHSEEEKQTARVDALTSVQSFLGIDSENLIKLYLGFDKELMCWLKRERMTSVYYDTMFYQRYCECLSGEQIVNWGRLRFPIESDSDLRNACYDGKYKTVGRPNESVINTIVLGSVITNGGVVMFDQFRRMYNIDKKE